MNFLKLQLMTGVWLTLAACVSAQSPARKSVRLEHARWGIRESITQAQVIPQMPNPAGARCTAQTLNYLPTVQTTSE